MKAAIYSQKKDLDTFLYLNRFISELALREVAVVLHSEMAENLNFSKEFDTFSGKERIPMGVHLKNHFKDFPLIYIYYKKGTFYNFGVQELPKKDFENSLEILHKKNLDYYIWMEKATAIEFDNN